LLTRGLGQAIKPNDPTTQFSGYSDPKATEKKIVRNAFAKGDAYFSTGDLLSRDSKGYYRFVDRIGDTFRWKGENCSTTEVTEVLSTFPGVEEANVYGVLIRAFSLHFNYSSHNNGGVQPTTRTAARPAWRFPPSATRRSTSPACTRTPRRTCAFLSVGTLL